MFVRPRKEKYRKKKPEELRNYKKGNNPVVPSTSIQQRVSRRAFSKRARALYRFPSLFDFLSISIVFAFYVGDYRV